MIGSDANYIEDSKCILSMIDSSWRPEANICCIGASEHYSSLQSSLHESDFVHPFRSGHLETDISRNLEMQEFHKFSRHHGSLCSRCCCLQRRLESVLNENSAVTEEMEQKIQQMRVQVKFSFVILIQSLS
jgi:hypothetical protein